MIEQAGALSVAASSLLDAPARDRALSCILAYEIFARFHPDDFHILEYLGYPWVVRKLPDGLRDQYRSAVTGFSQQLGSHIQAAVDEGSLKLVEGTTVANLTFHSIALVYGTYSSIIKNRVISQLSDSSDVWRSARMALDSFWDGSGWSPSSTQVDYIQRADEILEDLYPEYWLKTKTAELERELERKRRGKASS